MRQHKVTTSTTQSECVAISHGITEQHGLAEEILNSYHSGAQAGRIMHNYHGRRLTRYSTVDRKGQLLCSWGRTWGLTGTPCNACTRMGDNLCKRCNHVTCLEHRSDTMSTTHFDDPLDYVCLRCAEEILTSLPQGDTADLDDL